MGFDFDDQPSLKNARLRLRALRRRDFDALQTVASDPRIWAGHPAKQRHRREVFAPYFDFLLNSGGTLVVFDRARDTIIGCSRYYVPPDQPQEIGIGFTFLAAEYWGGEVNFSMKELMLDHAFEHFPNVWFHIDPTNLRSQKATEKLGAVRMADARLTLGAEPADWMCYRLTRGAWAAIRAARQP